MYHNFYQLKENPFNVTADPDFFYSSKCHREAISSLSYGVEQRKGIVLITGEIGTGKTTLCRKFLKQSTKEMKFALILNPSFSELDLLKMIIQDLGMSVKRRNKFGLMQLLNDFLITESTRGCNVALVIDEAQNLSITQLEQIRLLSNLETEKEKLLQIVLVGQPELHEKLKLPELRQLRQRVSVHFHIQPLPKDDIRHYIRERMTRAAHESGSTRDVTFTDQAIEAIYQYTQGTPRTINILCDRALLVGFIKETYHIDEEIIENCAKEVLYCEHYL
jgi:general secretion pathway protein A